jgi:hypothetical protein
MSDDRADVPGSTDPLAQLERALIAEFLLARGHDPDRLHELPEEEMHRLLTEASRHASARLVEVESRAHYVSELHGGPPSL